MARPAPSFPRFVALSVVSGVTIGMNKVLVTLTGLSFHAHNWQLGVISSAESLAIALGTIPAGLLVGRFGPRVLYCGASALLASFYWALPGLGTWLGLSFLLFLGGLCIAFRIVSMGSSFLVNLPLFGTHRAGWYRGTLSLGTMAMGPWLGTLLATGPGLTPGFQVSSAFFLAMVLLGTFTLDPQGQPRITGPGRPPAPWYRAVWNDRPVRRACALEGLSGVTASFFGTFLLVLLLKTYAWTNEAAVAVVVVYGVAYVAVLLFGAPVLAWFGPRTRYGVPAAVLAGLGGLALSREPWHFTASALVLGVGLGLNNLANMTALARSEGNKGHLSSVSTLTQMAGGSLGTLVGGALGSVFPLQALFGMLGAAWVLTLWPPTRPPGFSRL